MYPDPRFTSRRAAPSLAALILLLPAAALAAPETELSPTPSATAPIVRGQDVAECGWPSVAFVNVEGGGNCTGTLVHPRLVTTAAHCFHGALEASGRVLFVEDQYAEGIEVSAQCKRNPAYRAAEDFGVDHGYCLLDTAVDLPITPMTFGCEADELSTGMDTALVGFGAMEGRSNGTGTKRWGIGTVSQLSNVDATIPGGNGLASSCPGDSGGPALVQDADGIWHSWAIVSGGEFPGSCGVDVHYGRADAAVAWIEQQSGIDVTPCFDADGSWNPTPQCGVYSASGEIASGTWADGCLGSAESRDSSTCGAAFDRSQDASPPNVTVTVPADGTRFEPGEFDGVVSAEATDPDGWDVRRAWLRIDGVDQPLRQVGSAYAFNTGALGTGSYVIEVLAEDWSGNVGRSALAIGIGQDPEPVPPGETGASGDSGTASEGGTGAAEGTRGSSGPETPTGGTVDEGAPASSSENGCQAPGHIPALAAVGFFALVRRRRQCPPSQA